MLSTVLLRAFLLLLFLIGLMLSRVTAAIRCAGGLLQLGSCDALRCAAVLLVVVAVVLEGGTTICVIGHTFIDDIIHQ